MPSFKPFFKRLNAEIENDKEGETEDVKKKKEEG